MPAVPEAIPKIDNRSCIKMSNQFRTTLLASALALAVAVSASAQAETGVSDNAILFGQSAALDGPV